MKIKRIKTSTVKDLVIYPKRTANKYTRGKLDIIAGSNEYPGAACMTSSAALRCGTGYVEVSCEAAALPIVQAHNPNVVAKEWSEFSCQGANLDNVSKTHPKACLIGPGFSKSSEAQSALLEEVLDHCDYPLVIDGGAIEALSSGSGIQKATQRCNLGRDLVLTPHYGEAARLARPLGLMPPEKPYHHIELDVGFAESLSRAYGAIIVLKGAKTLVVDARNSDCGHNSEDGSQDANQESSGNFSSFLKSSKTKVYLMDKGPACLAKAGTGDVLSGMLAAFLSQGMTAIDACKLAVYTHAKAAIFAQKELTAVCVCATDVIDALPLAFKSYE